MKRYTCLPQGILDKHYSEQQLFDILYQASLFEGKLLFIGRLLERAASLAPNNVALMYKEQTISYHDLYARAVALSKLLQARGVQKKDRVLLFWENAIEFYVAYFAVLQLGAVIAPLNVFLTEAEVVHIIADAQPRLMIVSDELFERIKNSALPPLVRLSDFPAASGCATADMTEAAALRSLPSQKARINEGRAPSDEQEITDFKITDLEPEEMAALLYTSGTTGFPKGVMTSSKNAMTNVLQGIARLKLGLEHGERLLGILPLFHSFAQFVCIWGAFFTCSTVIVVPRIERRYLLEGLKKQPTMFLGVPALYGLLLLLRRINLDSIKYFVSGGDALQDKICAGFELLYRRKICSGYGLTETSPLISAQLEDEAVSAATVGKLVVGIQAEVRDENGKPLPQGQIGELWVKGDNIMLGYYNAPEATDAVLKNGWFNTGDNVYFDSENRLVIAGRVKDVIASKGIKIYPQEIENVIMSHPQVIRVGVIGREEKSVGQVPVAYVQVREITPTLETELQELCSSRLAPYKIPRAFICVTDGLPITATGKVDKKRLNNIQK